MEKTDSTRLAVCVQAISDFTPSLYTPIVADSRQFNKQNVDIINIMTRTVVDLVTDMSDT